MAEMDEFNLFDEDRLRLALQGLLLALDPEVRASLRPGLDLHPQEDGWFGVTGVNRDGDEVQIGSFDRIILLRGGLADIGTN
jgi:hypothetical protein